MNFIVLGSDSEDQVDLKKLMEKVKMLENQIIRQQCELDIKNHLI